VRVLYSFPLRIGAERICQTAWHQVAGAHEAGAHVIAVVGDVQMPLPEGVDVRTTLRRGRLRVPFRAIGVKRAFRIHDELTARMLPRLSSEVDLVHCWPLGGLRTMRAAQSLGIPSAIERPNAHTGFAFEAVAEESRKIGVPLPRGSEHAFDARHLAREEAEYEASFRILCPSDFVASTFVDRGYPPEKLVRNTRGFDPERFRPPDQPRPVEPFTVAFVGYAAVRKGLHFALEAWLRSPASATGRFLIAGAMLPEYRAYLSEQLAHPSVFDLGHRDDIPELMRECHAVTLPSVEEGFGRVCLEAMASGAVPLVSTACTDECVHEANALVHQVGDVDALTEHITRLYERREELDRLGSSAVEDARSLTWTRAGERLVQAYEEVSAAYHAR
jgi:glycosyltransferase involved in cell wall biosynthesis